MKQSKRINPFFVEIIIVLLFLSFTCVILLQIFSSSAILSKRSSDMNTAVLKTQSYFEELISYKTNDEIATKLSENEIKFDENWGETESSPSFILTSNYETTESEVGTTYTITISVKKEDGYELYTADLSKFINK